MKFINNVSWKLHKKKLDKSYHKIFFSGIAFNSSHVKKNNIFFAIKGNKFDGNNYIEDAIKKELK